MMREAAEAFRTAGLREQRRALKAFQERWREKEPKAVERFEHHLQRCFEANSLPAAARSKATTTGMCEGLFRQIRARIRKIGPFETPRAVELYIFAIVAQKQWIAIPGRNQAAPLIPAFTHSY